VPDDAVHSIKLKRHGIEFELTGSAEVVGEAWAALQPTVVDSFPTTASPSRRRRTTSRKGASTTESEVSGGDSAPRRRTAKRAAATSDGASKNIDALLAAHMEDFPEIGDEPPGLYAAYATLKWASDKLQIDGLTAVEIRQFLRNELGIKNTSNAYRMAFKDQPRAVDASSTYPTVYKLMHPGERALEAYLASVQQRATTAEAEAAAQRAEEEAAKQ
jgi:hypothetical protein